MSKGNLNSLFDKVLQIQKQVVEGRKSVSLANLRFQVTNINPRQVHQVKCSYQEVPLCIFPELVSLNPFKIHTEVAGLFSTEILPRLKLVGRKQLFLVNWKKMIRDWNILECKVTKYRSNRNQYKWQMRVPHCQKKGMQTIKFSKLRSLQHVAKKSNSKSHSVQKSL